MRTIPLILLALLLHHVHASAATTAPASTRPVVVYDVTYETNAPTGVDPAPGTRPARWWLFHRAQWDDPRQAVRQYVADITAPPLPVRVAILDTEGLGYRDAERLLPAMLDALQEQVPAKVLVIGDWWPGLPEGWSAQRVLAALEGSRATRTAAQNRDRAAMFALARKHRHIVRRAGVVVYSHPVDRIDPSTPGANDGFEGTVRRMELLAGFAREAWPGTEIVAWTGGYFPHPPDFAPLPDNLCERLLSAAMANYDGVAIYGERRHAGRLLAHASRRLTSRDADLP